MEAMRDSRVVVHAAGTYPRTSLDPQSVLTTGLSQSRRVLDAAAEAGVERLIYLSSTGTVAPSQTGMSDERHTYRQPTGRGLYHELKWRMEEVFLEEDRFGVHVLCPGACVGPWDLRIGTTLLLVATARGMDPPHPEGVISLVDVGDVGRAVAATAVHRAPPKRVLLCGHHRSLHGLLVEVSEHYGVSAPSDPLSAAQALEMAEEEERCAEQQDRRPTITRAIVELIIHGVPIDAGLAVSALGLSWTPWSETLAGFDKFARLLKMIPEPHARESSASS